MYFRFLSPVANALQNTLFVEIFRFLFEETSEFGFQMLLIHTFLIVSNVTENETNRRQKV